MDKEQASMYVINTTKTEILSKKFQYEFLCINLILLLASFVFYRELTFICLVLSFAGLYTIATIMIAKKKPNFIAVTVLGCAHLIVICIAFNLWVYAMYQEFGGFVLWIYLLSIGIQVLALFFSVPIVMRYVKKFKPKEGIAKSEIIAASVAGFTYALTTVLFRIFAPSTSIAGDIMSVLATMLGVFVSLGIVAGFYKVYLIKKYNIEYAPE